MGVGSGLYNVVLLLHVTSVVVGFGPLFVAGAYTRSARTRGGAEGAAIGQANQQVIERLAEKAIYAVPVFGILLVVLSDGQWGFEQLWITLSFVLYIAVVVLLRVVVIPTQRQLNEATAAPASSGRATGARQASSGGQLEQLTKKLAASNGALNLLVVVLIGIMIWKPGL